MSANNIQQNKEKFISVDWGTTNLRIRVVQADILQVVEELVSDLGVKTVCDQWLKTDESQEDFYVRFLKEQFDQLHTAVKPDWNIVISGMASSTIGLRELPYAELPFKVDGTSILSQFVSSTLFSQPILLVSGVRSEHDVMRGEEVQIMGLAQKNEQNELYILPGTHSKHIIVDDEYMLSFKTFMTGELFDIVSKHSILSSSIEKHEFGKNEEKAFAIGVQQSISEPSILSTLFTVRTNSLFEKMSAEQNYYYMSGLIIGEELRYLSSTSYDTIYLCASGLLLDLYKKALELFHLSAIVKVVSQKEVDQAVIKGHWKILENVNN